MIMSKGTDTGTSIERCWQGVVRRSPSGILRNVPGMLGSFILLAWWEPCCSCLMVCNNCTPKSHRQDRKYNNIEFKGQLDVWV